MRSNNETTQFSDEIDLLLDEVRGDFNMRATPPVLETQMTRQDFDDYSTALPIMTNCRQRWDRIRPSVLAALEGLGHTVVGDEAMSILRKFNFRVVESSENPTRSGSLSSYPKVTNLHADSQVRTEGTQKGAQRESRTDNNNDRSGVIPALDPKETPSVQYSRNRSEAHTFDPNYFLGSYHGPEPCPNCDEPVVEPNHANCPACGRNLSGSGPHLKPGTIRFNGDPVDPATIDDGRHVGPEYHDILKSMGARWENRQREDIQPASHAPHPMSDIAQRHGFQHVSSKESGTRATHTYAGPKGSLKLQTSGPQHWADLIKNGNSAVSSHGSTSSLTSALQTASESTDDIDRMIDEYTLTGHAVVQEGSVAGNPPEYMSPQDTATNKKYLPPTINPEEGEDPASLWTGDMAQSLLLKSGTMQGRVGYEPVTDGFWPGDMAQGILGRSGNIYRQKADGSFDKVRDPIDPAEDMITRNMK